jgi:hypothetical protein
LSSERRDGVSCDAYGLPTEQNCDTPWEVTVPSHIDVLCYFVS